MKKKTSISPMQRSLKLLREQGYLVAITEHYNFYAHIRQDLFNMFDLVAIKGKETLAIQATSAGNLNARISKIKSSPNYEIVKKAGWKICVYGWSKKGKRGERKTWQVKIKRI